jgi:uncharacterized protein YyaL (SSP411 family)
MPLIREIDPLHLSPYLAQHVDNPVAWWAWGPDALAEAARRDVPVLVSVGYSACHWCHVMAHESFEDPVVARALSDGFVAVKVDREERPDVDAVYMEATQAMSGSGGWPMTVFAFPDGRPFFAGTYFPRDTRGNHIGFLDLCHRITEVWHERRGELDEQAQAITDAIAAGVALEPATTPPSRDPVGEAVPALLAQVDRVHGGFGRAPKFPQSMSIDVLLRHHAATRDTDALDAAVLSLDAMAAGGIYDHLGGGFARYSTDERWLVPHFEKMLYDQALLVPPYLHAWQLTGDERHLQVVRETVGYVLRDLRHPAGGFFAAEDADSEGVEGRFYVWSLDEVREVCGPDADAAIAWYGVSPRGNWEGANILERPRRGDLARPPEVERARAALFAARSRRVRPGLDRKVLTEWNALWVAALAEAGGATGEQGWIDAAATAGAFLCERLRRDDGRWLRSWLGPDDAPDEGRAQFLAYAADHGALVEAFVRLHEATGDQRWLREAERTSGSLIELFWDAGDGGVFSTGNDADALVARPKDLMDNATPSANSTTAVGLARLAALTGDRSLRGRADDVVALLADPAARHPQAFGHLLAAADQLARGAVEVVVTGDRPDLVRAARSRWVPRGVLTWGPAGIGPLWEGRTESGSDGRAYVCRDAVCDRPATTPDQLVARLDAAR